MTLRGQHQRIERNRPAGSASAAMSDGRPDRPRRRRRAGREKADVALEIRGSLHFDRTRQAKAAAKRAAGWLS